MIPKGGFSVVNWKDLKESQVTFSCTLIRLEAFKRIFVFHLKIAFFVRGKSMVFGQK